MRALKTHQQIKAEKQARVAAKRPTRIKKSAQTKGGRNSNPAKLRWLREQKCLVAVVGKNGSVCYGVVEVHHDRLRGARATDARTLPLCSGHHRVGPYSVERLGRRGFEGYLGTPIDGETAWYEAEFARSRRSSETPK